MKAVRLAIVLMVACVAIATFSYFSHRAREAACQSNCTGNLSTIDAILSRFEQKFGHYPPVVVTDDDGVPIHSWRLLLARFEYPEEFEGYKMDEPWDSQNNLTFAKKIPAFFRCGNDSNLASRRLETSYVALTGITYAKHDLEKDGERDLSHFIVVEVSESGVPWTKPTDLNIIDGEYSANNSGMTIRSSDPHGPAILAPGNPISRFQSSEHADALDLIELMVKEPQHSAGQ